MRGFFTFAASLVLASAAQGPPPTPSDLPSFVGLQHFQPCYYIDASIPCFLDGAMQIGSRIGSSVFKFALKASTPLMYPYNNDAMPWGTPTSLAQLAAHPQMVSVLGNQGGATNFSTFIIWAYRVQGGDDDYWCSQVTPGDLADETSQFASLTAYLLQTYAGSSKSFYLEHWEGDWASRCGSYDPLQPPSPAVVANMIAWLGARQAGVEAGRAQACRAMGLDAAVDCSDGAAVMRAAGAAVYHGTEVNLVAACLTNATCGNLVETVVPNVALDTVSYSSYDCMGSANFGACLDLIVAKHNKTAASPAQPVWVTEWGLALNEVTPQDALWLADNVLGVAATRPAVARTVHWQVINNELSSHTLCSSTLPPVFDPTVQRGFWAVLPNGTLSVLGSYLQGIISGAVPFPTPPTTQPSATLQRALASLNQARVRHH